MIIKKDKKGKITVYHVSKNYDDDAMEKKMNTFIDPNDITQQRKFIVKYFPEGQYVISIDDDMELLEKLQGGKLAKDRDVDGFFKKGYDDLKKHGLYIWGIYPVQNKNGEIEIWIQNNEKTVKQLLHKLYTPLKI
jgi:hypothetical protein